ncbi:MAG: M48 family metallopeptidase [Chloroflexota bacterium]|nr:M48 family metallopeptidase [Chloroflexota bacterium]
MRHPLAESFVLDDLAFELRRSSRRKTISITLERDGALILTVPPDCPPEQIARVVGAQRRWIYTKLARQELLHHPSGPKEYVSGEGFAYLGRTYRLLLVDPPSGDAADTPALRLHQGRFHLRRDERHHAAKHFVTWYVAHGTPWLRRRVDLLAERIGVSSPPITVRDLGYRWGSCSRSGTLQFHWRTLQLPPRIIEYVVTHEMIHLLEPHHGQDFWRRLQRVLPDFAGRKQWLAERGASLGGP